MEEASPLKSGFLRVLFFGDSAAGVVSDLNDDQRVVTFRALVIRPLQTGVTRHRFPFQGRVRVPLSSASHNGGTDRPGGILTLAIACA